MYAIHYTALSETHYLFPSKSSYTGKRANVVVKGLSCEPEVPSCNLLLWDELTRWPQKSHLYPSTSVPLTTICSTGEKTDLFHRDAIRITEHLNCGYYSYLAVSLKGLFIHVLQCLMTSVPLSHFWANWPCQNNRNKHSRPKNIYCKKTSVFIPTYLEARTECLHGEQDEQVCSRKLKQNCAFVFLKRDILLQVYIVICH